MKPWLLVATMLVVVVGPARAASVSVTDQNATLKFSFDDPAASTGQPSSPLQLPRTVEWTVDGRRILVYPSSPFNFVDLSHFHAGSHVGPNQIHAQGPMLGYATSNTAGTVTGGVVYSVHGGATGSGVSRITERVEVHNKGTSAVPVLLAGFGFKSPQAALEVPDFTGLDVTGTTVVFYQGSTQGGTQAELLSDPPFAPLTVLPVVSFTGFNPLLNQNLNLPAGAFLTMVTELKVERAPLLTLVTVVWIIAVLVLAGAAAMMVRRRRDRAAKPAK